MNNPLGLVFQKHPQIETQQRVTKMYIGNCLFTHQTFDLQTHNNRL
ncbi:hypothetical protein GCWU000325_01486 [Alloprevotella tannerae ATCC 51259]|uniref:Uncharacterized protein n=1 Tax=Alloprevotella tannerae ATCC 51259 TaxID=626522 RepID=C9LGY5_9BACT|nr:hypothetical protein GCWU000325_01486 [Alloprevotella tannerae ATCC 51259]